METSIASSPSIDKQEIVDSSIHHDLELEDHTMEVEKQVKDVVVTEQNPLQEGDTSTLGSYVGPSTIHTSTCPPYDYTEHFTTEMIFPSDEALVDWIRCTGKQHGFIIVIKGSEKCIKNRTPRMRFSCGRSSKYRLFVKKVDGKEVAMKKRVRSTGTKKGECPFELKAVKGNDGWTISVHNGTHNHPPAVYLEGYSEILTHLKVQDPENVTSIKTVYNVRQKYRVIEKAGKSKMQHLLDQLEKYNWGLVVLSASVAQYEERLCVLKCDFEMVPAALEYVEKNWLVPYKERAESSHSKLKNHIENSQCNFDTIWEKIHRLMLFQVTEVKASFENSLNYVQHDFRTTLFDRLRGSVLSNAMTLILVASHQVEWFVESKRQCECSLRHTHGLPCAHEIAPYKMANPSTDRVNPRPLEEAFFACTSE
ncbi:hypothetical protein RHGRI_016842 [Rhododendron griersonianum]|uniref:Protein FAR1-RELATED SEQUENCE n=1 Tax=Rhododendron griersonianum TaxID=479676 RepID=A0AAV6JVJ1_9ERIC|nr:hypothetical protein RHGRI_016842 [Rhododendron griersonianum]